MASPLRRYQRLGRGHNLAPAARALLQGAGAALLLSACAAPDHDRSPGPPTPQPPAAPALALVTSPLGAVLVVARPADGPQRGVLNVIQLDGVGETTARLANLPLPQDARVTGLQASLSENTLGVVWSEVQADEARIQSAAFDITSDTFSRHPSHARMAAVEANGRALLQTQSSGEIRLMFAGDRHPCRASDSCLDVGFGALGGGTVGHAGKVSPRPHLELPEPCEQPLAAFAVLPGMWHYAVCSRLQGAPQITLFSAQPEPAYAQAQQLPLGCNATGHALLGEELWLSARCGNELDHVFVIDRNGGYRQERLSRRRLVCRDGALSLRLNDALYAFPSRAEALQALLPAELATAEARAVWTGEALLVANARGADVRVHSHRCSHSLLTSRSYTVAAATAPK